MGFPSFTEFPLLFLSSFFSFLEGEAWQPFTNSQLLREMLRSSCVVWRLPQKAEMEDRGRSDQMAGKEEEEEKEKEKNEKKEEGEEEVQNEKEEEDKEGGREDGGRGEGRKGRGGAGEGG